MSAKLTFADVMGARAESKIYEYKRKPDYIKAKRAWDRDESSFEGVIAKFDATGELLAGPKDRTKLSQVLQEQLDKCIEAAKTIRSRVWLVQFDELWEPLERRAVLMDLRIHRWTAEVGKIKRPYLGPLGPAHRGGAVAIKAAVTAVNKGEYLPIIDELSVIPISIRSQNEANRVSLLEAGIQYDSDGIVVDPADVEDVDVVFL